MAEAQRKEESIGEALAVPEEGAGGHPFRRFLSWVPGILLLIAVVGVANHFGEEKRFAEILQRARPAWVLVAAVLQCLTYICAAGVWHRVLHKARARCTLRSLVPIAVARLFVDQVIPTGGFGGRILVARALRRRGVHVGLAVAAILVDLLTLYAAFAVAVLASLAVFAFFRDLNRLILILAGLFAIFALSIPGTILWFSRSGVRETPRWIHRFPRADELLREVALAPRRLVRNKEVLTEAGFLQLAIFILDGATLWTMLKAVGYTTGPVQAFASFIFASVAGTVFLVPGGLGTFEASAVAMLALFKVPVEVGLTATLLLRGFTYWLPMAPGFWLSRRELNKKVPKHYIHPV